MRRLVFLILVFLLAGSQSFAWGKRGHEIVASIAAKLLEENVGARYLQSHEFDLGYYTNVPDIIWRDLSPEIGAEEGPQHYLDWNSDMKEAFGSPEKLPLAFSEYKSKMGSHFKVSLGVVPYRIHGFVERCKRLTKDFSVKRQGPLLVCIGVLSHYTGDLSMPLHTSENHDGQMTHQKGVHHYFESILVDALDPELKVEVLKRARELYAHHEARRMNPDQAVRWLIAESHGKADDLLSMDRQTDRKNIPDAAEKFKPMIVEQLAQGAVVTAFVWKDILKDVHDFDEHHFYYFEGKPEYVFPGKESAL